MVLCNVVTGMCQIMIKVIHTNEGCSYGMENHFVSNLTLSSSCCPKMVDGPQDEPEGPLLITTDPQNLHGCLQLGKLLRGPLLILSLADSTYIQIKFLFELLTTKIPIIRCLKVIPRRLTCQITS